MHQAHICQKANSIPRARAAGGIGGIFGFGGLLGELRPIDVPLNLTNACNFATEFSGPSTPYFSSKDSNAILQFGKLKSLLLTVMQLSMKPSVYDSDLGAKLTFS